ncbi:MAG: PDC sensor domain-containing protein [Gammaproteobacteria bacterium]|nr:PDC sensor domain-containing protein [Gammaproteobacteria bacterium]
MDPELQRQVTQQRTIINETLRPQTAKLAISCRSVLGDRQALESLLRSVMRSLPYCKYLWVLDAEGHQITSNISRDGIQPDQYGRDRLERPYMLGVNETELDFHLSDAYISCNKRRPSLTAVQLIRNREGEIAGYLGFDYDLRELPHVDRLHEAEKCWIQAKGDPSIRGNLFNQSRVESLLDSRVDEIIALLVELMSCHGVFHGKLHFSSSRATIWTMDNPYNYRILDFESLTDPDICLAYPRREYPAMAVVPITKIAPIFAIQRELRFSDDTIYLRSGSLNLCNGMVSLNFSCDGSHYIPYDEFLAKDLGFWFGQSSGQTRVASIEAEVERICDLGCSRVNQVITQADNGRASPELAGLTAADSKEVLDRLKSIMAVYAAREK